MTPQILLAPSPCLPVISIPTAGNLDPPLLQPFTSSFILRIYIQWLQDGYLAPLKEAMSSARVQCYEQLLLSFIQQTPFISSLRRSVPPPPPAVRSCPASVLHLESSVTVTVHPGIPDLLFFFSSNLHTLSFPLCAVKVYGSQQTCSVMYLLASHRILSLP